MEQELRQAIFEQLKKVTDKNCPKIYKMLATTEGYKKIEQKIINMLVQEELTPSACIPQIESEL